MDFVNWYFTSLAEFWGTAIRVGLPQLILVILLICWIRRSRCGKSAGKSCCWTWSCGSGSGGCSSCGNEAAPCGCTCGSCRCQTAAAEDEDEDGDA